MKIIKPITPKEIVDNIDKTIPEIVIQSVNNFIRKNYRNGQAFILQSDIVDEIVRLENLKENPISNIHDVIFKNHWLDFEFIYNKAGWNVTHEKSAYTENYFEPYFIFIEKSSNE